MTAREHGPDMDFDEVTENIETAAGQRDMRAITRCQRNNGWHVYLAGPCLDTYEQAIAYRATLDREGVTWKPQP